MHFAFYSHRLLSVDILDYGFRTNLKHFGTLNELFIKLERRSKVVTVAYSLVGYRFDVDIALFDEVAFTVILKHRFLCTVRDKHGEISKIIYMMINRSYSKRTHRCYDH